MSNPWFRMYHEFEDDPKVQIMPENMQRRLVMLFCRRCKDVTFHETQIAFHWRVSSEELAATKALFLEMGFIDEDWNILNWNKRQFISDSSTDRVRRHRHAKKQDETLQETHETGGVVTVTPPEAEQKQIQTQKQKEIKDSSSKNSSTSEQEEFIYQSYCRKVGKRLALKAIQKAVEVIIKGDQSHPPILDAYEARRYLCRKVLEYSSSPTAQPPPKGEDDFRPHPATWFNEGRYWDDPAEWRKQRNGTHNNRKNTGRNVENNQTHIADLIGEMQAGNSIEIRGDDFFPGSGGESGIFPSDGRKTIEGKL
jgi:hypothetical protein